MFLQELMEKTSIYGCELTIQEGNFDEKDSEKVVKQYTCILYYQKQERDQMCRATSFVSINNAIFKALGRYGDIFLFEIHKNELSQAQIMKERKMIDVFKKYTD